MLELPPLQVPASLVGTVDGDEEPRGDGDVTPPPPQAPCVKIRAAAIRDKKFLCMTVFSSMEPTGLVQDLSDRLQPQEARSASRLRLRPPIILTARCFGVRVREKRRQPHASAGARAQPSRSRRTLFGLLPGRALLGYEDARLDPHGDARDHPPPASMERGKPRRGKRAVPRGHARPPEAGSLPHEGRAGRSRLPTDRARRSDLSPARRRQRPGLAESPAFLP